MIQNPYSEFDLNEIINNKLHYLLRRWTFLPLIRYLIQNEAIYNSKCSLYTLTPEIKRSGRVKKKMYKQS